MIRTSKRGFLQGGAAVIAALLTDRATTANAQSSKVLVVLSGLDVPGLDPHATGAAFALITMARNTYDSLVGMEGTPPRLVPRLATSWTSGEGGMEYTFKLNPAARFHDGTPVTAEDVRYSIERILRTPQSFRWAVDGVIASGGTEVVDAHTVRIRLTKPFAPFVQVLPVFWIVNSKLVEANKGSDDGRTWLRNNVAGSGPFTVKRMEPGNLVELQRVSGGWRDGGGNLGSAIWKITREPATQRQLLAQGQGHMALGLNPEDMDALKDRKDTKLVIGPEHRGFHFKMNTRVGVLTDVNIRRAISCAVDYKAMVDVIGADYSELMVGPIPADMPGSAKDLQPWRLDLARAKEFLAKSSKPDGGFALQVVYLSGYEEMRRWCLVLLDGLKKLNIDLDIRNATFPDMVAQTRTPETTPHFRPGYTAEYYYDPDNLAYAEYHSSLNGQFQNPTYSNPKVDDLIVRARFETDAAKRAALYGEFQQTVMEDAPAIFGVWLKRRIAMRSNVGGFNYCPILGGSAPELFPLSLT